MAGFFPTNCWRFWGKGKITADFGFRIVDCGLLRGRKKEGQSKKEEKNVNGDVEKVDPPNPGAPEAGKDCFVIPPRAGRDSSQ
jgi:hypothetical protein